METGLGHKKGFKFQVYGCRFKVQSSMFKVMSRWRKRVYGLRFTVREEKP